MVSLNLDQPTVIKIAEAILVQIYGEKVLKQRPWKIIENDESFKIEGVMLPKIRGGVAEIVIRKSDGKVISYSHGK